MKPHAFIAMPFGPKPGADGQLIDFNRVYTEYIKPALEAAGFEVFRADEEQRAGDIRADMFQELLVADLVVADLTLDNPNVWYELGVRHALRQRGVILVQGPRAAQPFDIYTDRKLRYALKDGAPDPASLEADQQRLTDMARETLAAPTARKVSPVYALLDHLREPQWRDLLLSGDNEYAQVFKSWSQRMRVARDKQRAGDLLVLADETPTQALWLEAKRMAGASLLTLGHFDLALEQFEAALEVAPGDLACREKKGVCLGRLGRPEEADAWAQAFTDEHPTNPDAWALLGRLGKEDWISRWRVVGEPGGATLTTITTAQMRASAEGEDATLADAITPYAGAFRTDPLHYYSGINALTLTVLRQHLGGPTTPEGIDELLGGVRWAALAAQAREPRSYWPRVTLAELSLLCRETAAVVRDFKAAMAAAERDWFALDSTRQTLTLLRDVAFRPAETAAALQIVEAEITRVAAPLKPNKVLLFSGHMVDAPGRTPPRLPSAWVPQAAADIESVLDELGVGAGDLLLTQGAAGGDLLCAEGCLARGARVQLLLPQAEPKFIEDSVLRSDQGEAWRVRYLALRKRLKDAPRVLADELGPAPKGSNIYERCNLWLLHTALAYGQDKVHFICLWDGQGGDGPGGTAHMYNEVKRRTGQVHWLKPRPAA